MALILRQTMDSPNVIRLDLAGLVKSNSVQYCRSEHERRLREMVQAMDAEDIRVLITAIKDKLNGEKE